MSREARVIRVRKAIDDLSKKKPTPQIRRKIEFLLNDETSYLKDEFKLVRDAIQTVIHSINNHGDKYFSSRGNRTTMLTGILGATNKAIKQCEKELRLGKSRDFAIIANDLSGLSKRLNEFRIKLITDPRINNQSLALNTFKQIVVGAYYGVLNDFRTKVSEDMKARLKLDLKI